MLQHREVMAGLSEMASQPPPPSYLDAQAGCAGRLAHAALCVCMCVCWGGGGNVGGVWPLRSASATRLVAAAAQAPSGRRPCPTHLAAQHVVPPLAAGARQLIQRWAPEQLAKVAELHHTAGTCALCLAGQGGFKEQSMLLRLLPPPQLGRPPRPAGRPTAGTPRVSRSR